MRHHAAAILSVGLAIVSPASAQWNTIPYNPANPVHIEGFHVVHDDGVNLQAFSAVSLGFQTIAPTGSTVHGTGDWTALIQDGAGTYIGYSARLNAFAPAPVGPNDITYMTRIEDDVLLIVSSPDPPLVYAHAYSAQHNIWQTIALGAIPAAANVATSRFVIGILDGNQLDGFSARKGAWVANAAPGAGNLGARGNVLTADLGANALAFSGVTGQFALSPALHAASVTRRHHNVASCQVAVDNGLSECGFSAYTGGWVTSPIVHANPAAGVALHVNLVRAQYNLPLGPAREVFGARPGLNWALLPPAVGGGANEIALQQDYLLLEDPGAGLLYAFSGLVVGGFVAQPYAGATLFVGNAGRHGLVNDTANDWHAFAPAHGAWAPVLNIGPSVASVGGALSVVDNGVQQHGYSARNNNWQAGPAPTGAIVAVSGGVVSRLDAGTGQIDIFNERQSLWAGPFAPGGAAMAALLPGNNLLVADGMAFGGNISAYSLARDDFAASPIALGAAVTGSGTDNDVAFVTTAGPNQLHAFGTTNETHVWYQYPNNSEYQVKSAGLGLPIDEFIVSYRGTPGDIYLLYHSLNVGVPLPLALGCPLVLAAPFYFSTGGTVPAGGLVERRLPLGIGSGAVHLWSQAVFFNLAVLLPGASCAFADPAWVF